MSDLADALDALAILDGRYFEGWRCGLALRPETFGSNYVVQPRLLTQLIGRIETRDWNWQLAHHGDSPTADTRYCAEVWHPAQSWPQVVESGDSTVLALTLAYVAALKGTG